MEVFFCAELRKRSMSSRPKIALAAGIPRGVHDAFDLVIAFETSKYLSLVSAIEIVWTTSD